MFRYDSFAGDTGLSLVVRSSSTRKKIKNEMYVISQERVVKKSVYSQVLEFLEVDPV